MLALQKSSKSLLEIMILIHMAHRGEAQEFIKNLHLKSDERMSGLYYDDNHVLLISGEGIYEVLSKIPYVLAIYPIKKILNFGIAGALDPKLTIESIIPVRTCYGFNEISPKFHSYSSIKKNATFDCITTDKRVLNVDFATQLNPYASLVDRELWAIGKCAYQYHIPFESYKLISDYAGDTTKCFDILDKALHYSEMLYEYYLKLEDKNNEVKITYTPPLAMSFSHRMQYSKLMDKLTKRDDKSEEQVLRDANLSEILSWDHKPKMKATQLIQRLEYLLNPVRMKIHQQLDNHFSVFKKIGAKVKMDPKLETKKFILSIEINDATNLTKLRAALEDFEFQKIEQLWDGEIDV